MRDHEQKYYLCKSGEVKRRAEEHRATFVRLRTKLWDVAKTFGSSGVSICDSMMLIRGLVFKGEPPDGWTKPKHRISYPKRGTLDPEMRKFFTPSGGYMVETHKELKAFGEWLGCPMHYSYKKGESGSGRSTIGRLFADGFTYWYAPDGPIMLELPDVAKAKARAEERGEIPDGNVLDWKPPKGLKEILHEEWKLMAARHRLAKGEPAQDEDDD